MANKWRTMLGKKKSPKKVVLDKDFAGIKAGSRLFVATPKIIDDYIRRIPSGQTRTIERLRIELAEGEALHAVAPFWRLIDPDSKVAACLTIDPEWIAAQRATEQAV